MADTLSPESKIILIEEGGMCPNKACDGLLEPKPVENCSCHINPPCPACEGQVLWCPECTWEPEYGVPS
jgi:hypothetical protein